MREFDSYFYPGSSMPANKFGIRNAFDLDDAVKTAGRTARAYNKYRKKRKRCITMGKTMMKLGDVRVPDRFLACPPKAEKIRSRMESLEREPDGAYIRVNGAGWLTDCYATYMAARELGLDRIRVKPGREDCLVATGTYHQNGKEYAWEVPSRIEKDWAGRGVDLVAGLPLAVRDAHGKVRRVEAVRFDRLPWPTAHGEILGMWARKPRDGKEGGSDA